MNILTITRHGDLTGLSQTLYREGHEAALYRQGGEIERPYPTVRSWRENFKRADLVVCGSGLPSNVHSTLEQNGINRLNSSLSWEQTRKDQAQMEEIAHLLNGGPHGGEYEPGMYPISVMGIWNGYEFLRPFFLVFEEYTWGPGRYGDIDPTGATGSVLHPVVAHTRVYEGSLAKVEDLLKLTGFKGFFQLHGFIYQEKLIWTGFSTPASGPTMDALGAVTKGSMVGTLNSLAQGTLRTWPCQTQYVGTAFKVCSTVMGYVRPEKEQLRHMLLYDVIEADGAYAYTAGQHIATVTARGDQLTRALGRAHRTIENTFPLGIKFKADLGRRVYRPYQTLKDFMYNTNKIGGGLWSHLRDYDWIN